MATGFFWDERTFWHGGGNYAFTLPVGGLIQPLAAGGLPESPETKRRLVNLMNVTGLMGELDVRTASEASTEALLRVHPQSYLDTFKEMSDNGGGELGLRVPFARGGYELAALSAGLSIAAVEAVLTGDVQNAYALSRPPGHHCLPDYPNGFCLMANIAIAIEAAKAKGLAGRVAVLDWDVHHGNGTEAIFYERDDVLTLSFHQEGNYPLDTGALADRGKGAGEGYNINLPLPAGAGHTAYLHAMDRVAIPAIRDFAPDIIIIASGYDASAVDPLARMIATADTYRQMTHKVKDLAAEVCDGKLVLVHEGGYSEVYVPFCAHAAIEAMSGSAINLADPFGVTFEVRQPGARFDAFLIAEIDRMAEELGL
ncbi:Acetoin utilization deacetylase AcuC [Pseudosulfitobacter pseudonitzschiae]|uniref:Acetoin utilization protein n=1 Tax=Pseudosulfitobacter pseudonitzschiae TaxID=1402135 RepID=A0A073J1H5_9RHOB|nr:class II histone deacetylase [Pseudosulfitobacter pseudonitzschiae]KEJ95511.1 acetoin utilization protein [Pseudosulfitobacter pseudonitzschiae]QKS10103.1 class II histone deacetylase [Pseudosulfitobacter pseudonitzschiae]SHE85147.1 Acetoin utilization deacetylase AcuC [Pseudosulfitobacter pseudonitzschiae]